MTPKGNGKGLGKQGQGSFGRKGSGNKGWTPRMTIGKKSVDTLQDGTTLCRDLNRSKCTRQICMHKHV